MKRGIFCFIIFCIAVVLLCYAGEICAVAETAQAGQNISQADALQNEFIEVAKKAGPAVVSISTVHKEKIGIRRYGFSGLPFSNSPFNDEMFNRFFNDFFEGMPEEREFQQRGLGSGVIIDESGLILTNEHVIRGADEITVALPDGRKFSGKVKGADLRSDIALIKINAEGLPYAELGDSDRVKIGQWAIAIGNPFAYMVGSSDPTVTVGVISALNRSIRTQQQIDTDYSGLIQTDAAINPGNSGGPLVDINGNVIGINVAIFSTSGGYQGIGFAIPINRAKQNIPDLAQGKKILYGWVGVQVQSLTEELAKFFQLPDTNGVLVTKVIEGAPAAGAGVKEQDVIMAINDEPVKDTLQLIDKISHSKVGTSLKFSIRRSGTAGALNITVKIAARPQEGESLQAPEKEEAQKPAERLTKQYRGLEVCVITPEIAKHYGLENESGVIVCNIDSDSPAYQAGLRVGDVIEQINRVSINSLEDFSRAVNSTRGDGLVRTQRGYTILKEQ